MAGLRDKYCIVGVGETSFSRNSGRSTRDLGTEAVRNAMTDAGLHPWEVDGMLNYHVGDMTLSQTIATDLGIRLDFYTDTFGGGSSTETIIGIATGVIEAGLCHTVAVYRSMNGYSGVRQGGSPASGRPAAKVRRGPGPRHRPLRLVQPGPELPVHLRPPHVRVRHDQRAAGPREGGLLATTPRTTPGPTTTSG